MFVALKDRIRGANHTADSDKANGLGLYYPVPLTNLQPGDDADPDAPQPIPGRQADATPQAFAGAALVLLVKMTIVGFALYGFFHALVRGDHRADTHVPPAPPPPTPTPTPAASHGPTSCNCGHGAAEAAALGCVFDPVAVAWLPARCRDDALVAEFNAAGDWTDGHWLYTTATPAEGNSAPAAAHANVTTAGGREMSLADVGALPAGHFFASTMRWHVTHCAYVWLKQVRARHPPRGGGRKGTAGAGAAVQLEKRFDNEEHVRHCLEVFLDRRPLEALHVGFAVTTVADGEPDTPVKGHWKTVKGAAKGGAAAEHAEPSAS